MIDVPINPRHNKEEVLYQLSKYKPKRYNRFWWWRRYQPYNNPLPKKSFLLQRIKNGDFENYHYFWDAELCLHEMKEKALYSKTIEEWIELTQTDRARHKRLLEDFYKNEIKILEELQVQFLKYFKISLKEYENEVFKFNGNLEEFFMYIKNKY